MLLLGRPLGTLFLEEDAPVTPEGAGGAAFGFGAAGTGASDGAATGGASFGFGASGTGESDQVASGGASFGFRASGTAEFTTVTASGGAAFGFAVHGGNGAVVSYAVIVAGRVQAIGSGTLPTSTLTTLYFDLTGYSTPSIGDYFSEVCQTFSSAAPTIPPGDIAPPYPPGTTPPVPGDEDYPGSDLPDDLDPKPLATVRAYPMAFHADGETSFSFTAAASLTEIDARLRTKHDCTDVCAVRLHTRVIAECADAEIVLCYYDTADLAWRPVSRLGSGPTVSIASTGDNAGDLLNVRIDAQADVWLSPFVRGGDGSTTVTLGNLGAMLKMRVDEGECPELDEGDGCAIEEGVEWLDWSQFPDGGTNAEVLASTPGWWGSGAVPTTAPGNTYTYLDTDERFDGNPTLYGSAQDDGAYGGAFIDLDFATDGDFDRAVKLVLRMDADAAVPTTGDYDGLAVMWFDVKCDGPDTSLYLFLKNGTDLVVMDSNDTTEYPVGDVSLIADDTYKNLIGRVTQTGTNEVRFRLYAGDACEAVTEIYDGLHATGDNPYAEGCTTFEAFYGSLASPFTYHTAQGTWANDPVGVFGLEA